MTLIIWINDMSTLIDSIMNVVTGRISTQRIHPMMCVISETNESLHGSPMKLMIEHRVEIRFGSLITYLPKDSKLAMNNIQRQFKDLVYGDFRASLNRMEIAILEQDTEKLRMEMDELIREVSP